MNRSQTIETFRVGWAALAVLVAAGVVPWRSVAADQGVAAGRQPAVEEHQIDTAVDLADLSDLIAVLEEEPCEIWEILGPGCLLPAGFCQTPYTIAALGGDAVPQLILSLDSASPPAVRIGCLIALREIGSDVHGVSAAICSVLRSDPNGFVRQGAAKVLGQIGDTSRAVVCALVSALDDPRTGVRLYAIEALERIGPAASASTHRLLRSLREEESYARGDILRAVSRVAPDSEEAVSEIIAFVEESRDSRFDEFLERSAAVRALGEMTPKRTEVTATLLRVFEEYDAFVFGAAVDALRKVDPKNPEVGPMLMTAMQHADSSVRYWAIEALPRLEARPSEAETRLRDALTDPSCEARILAAKTLFVFDRGNDAALDVLVKSLGSKNRQARYDATVALGEIGEPAKRALPALRKRLIDQDTYIRQRAREAIESIGFVSLEELLPFGAVLSELVR